VEAEREVFKSGILGRAYMLNKKTTRREFVKLASMAAASMSLGCISNEFVNKFKDGGKNPQDYPVVVIGAGMGGLAGAVYLSQAGFPVTLIERHTIPGGYATAFRRGDFNFEVSLHFFSIREDMYQELGLDGKVERIPLHRTIRVIRKGKDFIIPELSAEEYIEFSCKNFPAEKEGIRSFYEYCIAVADEVTRFGKKMDTGSVFLPLLPVQYPKMWALRNMTFSDLLDKFIKNSELKSSIAGGTCGVLGLPPSQASGFMAAVLVGFFLSNKYYYFKYRSQDLSNALASVIEEHKGKIIYGKTVDKIITENNSVTGVRTEDGKVYPARIVVSNANAPDTFGKFLSDNKKAEEYMKKLAQYKPSISSFIVWLGLRGELRGKVPGHTAVITSGYDIETDFKNYLSCDADKTPIFLALYDNYYKGYSKPGTSTITIMILSGYEPWRRFEKDYFAGNKKEYTREKERIAKILIKRVEEKIIPGLSSKIQVMEASTPLTNMRFTKNPEGAIYGYPSSVDNAFMNRVKNTTPIEGLYLSSGWGSHSGSYTGGIMNGRGVCRKIMRNI
jgi:phytoene dehydrogenase-like protein